MMKGASKAKNTEAKK